MFSDRTCSLPMAVESFRRGSFRSVSYFRPPRKPMTARVRDKLINATLLSDPRAEVAGDPYIKSQINYAAAVMDHRIVVQRGNTPIAYRLMIKCSFADRVCLPARSTCTIRRRSSL